MIFMSPFSLPYTCSLETALWKQSDTETVWCKGISEQSSVPSLPFLSSILLCLVWHASDTQLEHATLNKRFGVS